MLEEKTLIDIGLKKSVTVLHMSDTHITHAEPSEGQEKAELAKRRKEEFCDADEQLDYVRGVIRKTGLPLIHTGDIIDFTSRENFAIARRFISDTDCFFAVGNHEFAQKLGEKEDEDYKAQTAPEVKKLVPYDIRFASRIIGGINFVAIDNAYYYFLPDQTDRLKREVQKGLPVVLCLHVPLYEKSLYAKQSELSAESVGSLCGVPDAYTNAYPEFRRLQQHTDAATARMIEYIAGETLIRAVLAGHLHYDYTSTLFDRVPQIVTGKSTLRTVEFR